MQKDRLPRIGIVTAGLVFLESELIPHRRIDRIKASVLGFRRNGQKGTEYCLRMGAGQ